MADVFFSLFPYRQRQCGAEAVSPQKRSSGWAPFPSSFIVPSHLSMARPRSVRCTPMRSKFSSSFPRIYAFSSNDIKVGSNIEVDGAPWRVLEFLHVKPGKGAAFVRTKVRNYLTGNTVEKTFRAGSTILEANIAKETKQFTYKDGAQYVFMDLILEHATLKSRHDAYDSMYTSQTTFEEFRLTEADVGDKKKWLKEGMDCNLLFWNGRVIDFELPIIVKLTVVDVDPGLKGDTVQGGSKPATLDTGAVVNVPLFVSMGEEILVDTRTGQYTSRA
ncbi:hypothetical protein ZIOFF_005458 [Zingiber officinale]|uniref:Elongation factor P n=1 Tax=Zingiber officinale TaxID=94328 RepID=A0A8J5LUW3_ZINOF|nr:hypothetical protein ZIOFF_005458 [Zingiber officinale]